jgi:hypothetical protein
MGEDGTQGKLPVPIDTGAIVWLEGARPDERRCRRSARRSSSSVSGAWCDMGEAYALSPGTRERNELCWSRNKPSQVDSAKGWFEVIANLSFHKKKPRSSYFALPTRHAVLAARAGCAVCPQVKRLSVRAVPWQSVPGVFGLTTGVSPVVRSGAALLAAAVQATAPAPRCRPSRCGCGKD